MTEAVASPRRGATRTTLVLSGTALVVVAGTLVAPGIEDPLAWPHPESPAR